MKSFRTVIAALLTAALMLSLCVTGFAADPAVEGDSYVYTTRETAISRDKNALIPVLRTENGIYCYRQESTGQRELGPGETLEYEGQLDIYRSRLYFLSDDGTMTLLDRYDPELDVEPASPFTDTGTPGNWISRAVQTPCGNLIFLYDVFESWSTAGEDVPLYSDEWYSKSESSERWFLRVLTPEGEEISLHQIEVETGTAYGYISGMADIDDSSVLISMEDKLYRVGTDGSAVPVEFDADGWIDSMMVIDDERLGVLSYRGHMTVDVLDRGTLKKTDSVDLGYDAYSVIPGSGDYLVYYHSGSALSGYNTKTGQCERIFQWMDVDLNHSRIGDLYSNADGSFTLVNNDWDDRADTYHTSLVCVLPVPSSSLPEKKHLTLATEYLSYDLSEEILSFNRTHRDIRIDVVTYEQYNTEDDWEAGRSKLITEILAGQMPDLLVLNGLPADRIAARGLLEDLNAYIDADPELDRADYFENVLDAMSRGGKLYTIVPEIGIQTLVGAKSIVGDGSGWTYDEVYEALEKLPEGADILGATTTQEEMLASLLSVNLNELVDWSTGQCSFNTPEFVQMLKFAEHFKSQFDWDSYEWSEEDSQEIRVRNGKQLVLNAYLWSPTELLLYGSYFGGEENVSFIGYPSSKGTPGNCFCLLESGIGMSSKCAEKEAAWEFLRTFLTEEYQTELMDGLPIHRGAFTTMLQDAMTPDYRKDAAGNRLLDENGEYLMWPKMTFYSGNEEITVYALTEAQAQKLTDLVESVDRCQSSDESITQIVLEQSAAFFAGQKSAEEVAKLIQSKASIYMNEQM